MLRRRSLMAHRTTESSAARTARWTARTAVVRTASLHTAWWNTSIRPSRVDRSAAGLFGFGDGVVTGGLGGEAVVVEAPGLAAGPFDFGGVGGLGVGEAGFCRFELGYRSIKSLLCVADLAVDGVGSKATVAAPAGGEGLAVFVEHYSAGDLGGSEFVELGELALKGLYGGQRFGRCGAIGEQRFG